jgi:hypothetical protein
MDGSKPLAYLSIFVYSFRRFLHFGSTCYHEQDQQPPTTEKKEIIEKKCLRKGRWIQHSLPI